MIELLDEIHPGEILLEDFMKPMGISARQLAADIDVPPQSNQRIGQWQTPDHRRYRPQAGFVFRHGTTVLAKPAKRIRHAHLTMAILKADIQEV